jgi:hypothetical protein
MISLQRQGRNILVIKRIYCKDKGKAYESRIIQKKELGQGVLA